MEPHSRSSERSKATKSGVREKYSPILLDIPIHNLFHNSLHYATSKSYRA